MRRKISLIHTSTTARFPNLSISAIHSTASRPVACSLHSRFAPTRQVDFPTSTAGTYSIQRTELMVGTSVHLAL